MIYNPGVLKRFYRSGSVFVLVLVFGQFFSCYSPEMQHYRKAQSLEMQGNSFEAEKEYLKALEEASARGEQGGVRRRRAGTESHARGANTIEAGPDTLAGEIVATYLRTAYTSQTVLEAADAIEGGEGALAAAQRAAEDGFDVAADYFVATVQSR